MHACVWVRMCDTFTHESDEPVWGCIHPRTPGVAAAADYVSARQQYSWLIPLQNPYYKLSQLNRSRDVWSASGHVIFGDFSKALPVLHAMFVK